MMPTENTIVETHGLTKRFGSGFMAVDGVDMSVRRGEVGNGKRRRPRAG